MTTNHPAHGPVSLDRLHQIREILSKAAAQSDGGNLGYAMADAVKVIDGAIAAFGAEPVAYIFKHPAGRLFWSLTDESNKRQSDVMPVYAAPVPSFVPPAIEPDYEVIKSILPTSNPDEYACCIAADMWNACRAAMLQAGNAPVTPDGYVLVPNRLTAENGAKGLLSGEFSETKFINCPECFGEDECETCDGSGRLEITVPVTWTTIKAIWAKGVEHFEAATQQENV
ncbi:hypothetical protein R4R92_004723 [Citrobacter freundii]|nr:hypothetical protein [Citrobacter freundii]ELR9594184.1 hypothetical protein [Citrobacter freundii]ELZ3595821.1 hypothetical protein [Citrobacter freundii]EMD6924848.1 hypothetical protein [Citrobacter freundii]HEH9868267.1 hypothetical protein [Citrobacter freundii]